MKKMSAVLILSLIAVCFSLPAQAEEPSLELGKQLFNNPGLGASTNDKSCNSCHPDGKGLEKADANQQLTQIINKCIKGPMQGEGINEETVAMKSLKLYLQSLAK
ncbi:MAG: cytochrome c peroxidase [Pseudomonadota bacterium]